MIARLLSLYIYPHSLLCVLNRTFFVLALVGLLLVAGCGFTRSDFDRRIDSITQPYKFSLLNWELKTLANEFKQAFVSDKVEAGNETSLVREYFLLIGQIQDLKSGIYQAGTGTSLDIDTLQEQLETLQVRRDTLENTVEGILERQIGEVLTEEGILNPLDSYFELKFLFPPVNFEFEQPPNLLVISPRDRVEFSRRVLLSPRLSSDTRDRIESEIDDLGVSSLVVKLGGFAAMYPTAIVDNSDLHLTLERVVEEWLHQYLAFKPLGFLYLFDAIGIRKSQEIATRNESLVGIVSKELGSKVYEKYYADSNGIDQEYETNIEAESSDFDFFLEMRETRIAVDQYLDQGMVQEAEEFMEQKRQYFAQNGYYIRKLNQAYFAFHGIYAFDPASVSPINSELQALRSESKSLKEFLDNVAWMNIRPVVVAAVAVSLVLVLFGAVVWVVRRSVKG